MSNVEILIEKENPLLKRKQVKILVETNKNPSMKEAETLISEKFKVKGEEIAIKEIQGKFGRETFLIKANIYKTKEDKEKTEPKQKGKKKKVGGEAATGEKTEEVPKAEEKTDEKAKKEEKKE